MTNPNPSRFRPPPEWFFDLLADYQRYPEWVAIVEEARLVKGDQIEAGAEYEEESPLGPIPSTSRWPVTEFDSPRRQVHVGELPFGPVELTIETRPDGEGGTILDYTVELTAFPRFRPLGWLLDAWSSFGSSSGTWRRASGRLPLSSTPRQEAPLLCGDGERRPARRICTTQG